MNGNTHTVLHLFERQVERDPNAIAVTSAHAKLSYGELNRLADELAAQLRACGVGPEMLVGLCVPRSPAMLVGALGIFKAGGAYLPLDPIRAGNTIEFHVQRRGRFGSRHRTIVERKNVRRKSAGHRAG